MKFTLSLILLYVFRREMDRVYTEIQQMKFAKRNKSRAYFVRNLSSLSEISAVDVVKTSIKIDCRNAKT